MKDFNKPYEINLETDLRTLTMIKSVLNKYFEDRLTPEEKEINRQAMEIHTAPYYFSLNPDYFEMGKEDEALFREMEIKEILKKAQEIYEKAVEEMPPNMKATYKSYLNSEIAKRI